ncbi:MAG: dihydroorotate dehydrogenase electron transfer subunit [Thermoplasmata archaeon]|nr:dihydroorotate dehydrogenase electron transfer subunit [Thermoplasmata archaeon]
MQVVDITDSINESDNIKTIKFKWPAESKPGQFIMVWIPGVDEIPMSLSYSDGITVDSVGEATQAIHALEKGSQIGIKGPYGNGFDLSGNDFLLIGGGTGIAALAMAAENLSQAGKKIRIAIGARTASDLLFVERMKALGEVHIATDDGSSGHHGFITQVAEKLITVKKPDMILACGPEPMMASAVKLAHKIPIQCSLERHMKCGFGICGSCQCGKFTVCKDGPVFSGEQLGQMEDFGKWKRDSSGKSVWF